MTPDTLLQPPTPKKLGLGNPPRPPPFSPLWHPLLSLYGTPQPPPPPPKFQRIEGVPDMVRIPELFYEARLMRKYSQKHPEGTRYFSMNHPAQVVTSI